MKLLNLVLDVVVMVLAVYFVSRITGLAWQETKLAMVIVGAIVFYVLVTYYSISKL